MARHEETRPPEKHPDKYDVLCSFTDPEDNGTVYWAGKSVYPRAGYEPTEERIAYLQSSSTTRKKPVIASKAKR